jgi:ligand-binding SRPBCC domain-containing protein
MANYTLQRESLVGQPLSALFQFFSDARNLESLTPPWLRFHILTPPPIEMRKGTKIEYQLRVRGIPLKWLSEIERWDPPFEFVDVQIRGPYRFWRHTHRFFEGPGGARMLDIVEYALPFGPLGRLVQRLQVAHDLSKIFDYREQRVREILG